MSKINVELKPRKCKAIQWKDNLGEMKMFCLDSCTITYEYAPGLDCYFNLVVWDSIKKQNVGVALYDYVVKIAEGEFTVIKSSDFDEWFEKIENNETKIK